MNNNKQQSREQLSHVGGTCRWAIGSLLVGVGGLCVLGMIVQRRISPELANGYLHHTQLGFGCLLGCWLFGSFALKWLYRFRWQKLAWVAIVGAVAAAGWLTVTRWQWLLSPFVRDENFYTAKICKWVMANSVWIGKGVSQLDQITMKIHFPSSDMVLFTGVLEFGKIYLVAAVVLLMIFFFSMWCLVSRISDSRMWAFAGVLAFVLLLQALFNFGVQFGLLPIFATHLPFVSFGNEWGGGVVDFLSFRDVRQTYCVFVLLGLILSAVTPEGEGSFLDRTKWRLPLVALAMLPMFGVFVAMRGTECRLPSSFMLHRIGERKSPDAVAVYDMYFSSRVAQSPYVMKRIAAEMNRTLPDGVETNKAFLAAIATQSILPQMSEDELKFLVWKLYRKGKLNYFVFHKSYVE